MITAVAVLTATCVLGRAARGRLIAVTVEGWSMTPMFLPGDVLLVWRGDRYARRGRVVVAARPDRTHGWRTPGQGWCVKRIVAGPGDPAPPWLPDERAERTVPPGAVVLLGTHPRSEDSKQWGYCPDRLIVGVVLLRLVRSRSSPGPRMHHVPGSSHILCLDRSANGCGDGA